MRAALRPASAVPNWEPGVELVRADLRVHEDLVSAFEGIGVVMHLAAAVGGDEDAQFASSVVGTERSWRQWRARQPSALCS